MHEEQIKPDYNYILNQQSPEPKKKTPGPKGLLFFGTIFVGVLCVVALLFFQVQPQTTGRENLTTDETVNRFMELMTEGKLGVDVYSLLSEELLKDSPLEVAVLTRYQEGIDFTTCEPQESKLVKDQQLEFPFACEQTNGVPINLVITVRDIAPSAEIIAHRVESRDA